MRQRLLEHRPQHGIVHHHRRAIALLLAKRVRDGRAGRKIDEAVGRIGGCLHQNQSHPAMRRRSLCARAHLRHIDAIGEAEGGDAESAHLVFQQRLGAAIERAAVQDRIARAQKGKAGGGDGRHAAGEDGGFLRLVPDRQPVLQNFQIGIVEAGIDQSALLARPRLPPPGGEIEKVLALLRVGEDKGGGEEDRRLQRSLRQARRIAIAHHQRFGMQLAVGDAVAVVVGVVHGCSPCKACRQPSPSRGAMQVNSRHAAIAIATLPRPLTLPQSAPPPSSRSGRPCRECGGRGSPSGWWCRAR